MLFNYFTHTVVVIHMFTLARQRISVPMYGQ